MKANNKKTPTGCPLSFGLDVFGDKWSLLVIREILLKGKRTYSEFLEIEEGIATNILIDRLKNLESAGLLNKTRDPENWRSYLYSLTQKGRDLTPMILEIILWSAKHDKRTIAQRDVLQKILDDRTGFQSELMQTSTAKI